MEITCRAQRVTQVIRDRKVSGDIHLNIYFVNYANNAAGYPRFFTEFLHQTHGLRADRSNRNH